MPDNRFGDDHNVDMPSRSNYSPGGSGAKVLRMTDGRIAKHEEDDIEDRSNPHEI